MNYFYADARNQPVGPVNVSELQRLLSMGVLNPNSWVIPQGETQWKPLAAVIPANVPPPLPAGHANPYAAPAATGPWHESLFDPSRMPGLRRPGYFFSLMGVILIGYIIMAAALASMVPGLFRAEEMRDVTEAEAAEIAGKIVPVIVSVALGMLVASFFLMAGRLRNIGWSPWLCLFAVVPIANIWIGISCLILPPGYRHTKKLDTAAIVLLVVAVLGTIGSFLFAGRVAEEIERQRRLHPEAFESGPAYGPR